MTEIDILIERLMEYFEVTRLQDLGIKLGVAQNTISGWRARNAVDALKKRMIENGIKLDIINKEYSSRNIAVGSNQAVGNNNHIGQSREDSINYKFNKNFENELSKLSNILDQVENIEKAKEMLKDFTKKVAVECLY